MNIYHTSGFYLLTVLLIFTCNGHAQSVNFGDGFEDGNFTTDPGWSGDDSSFVVINGTPNFQLRLDGDSENGGVEYLSTPSTDTIGTWEFYINLDGFSPSDGNRADIFLMSNIADLKGPVNGYALRAGEGGSSDVFKIVRYDTGSETETILSGTTDISSGGEFRIKVTRQSGGKWTLKVAQSYDGLLSAEGGIQTDATYTSTSYFGVRVTYTSSRFDKFFFDFKIDLPPFTVQAISARGDRTDVIFNRPYDQATIQASDFSIDNEVGVPSSVSFPAADTVRLIYENSLPSNKYTLTVDNIEDQNGKTIATHISTFIIYGTFSQGDVIINEFMYDPPKGQAEYVELKNLSGKYLNLQNWALADGTGPDPVSTGMLTLAADSFLVISADTSALFNTYGSRPYVQMASFPSLNNSGDLIKIATDEGTLTDSLNYTPDWGGEEAALERRSGSTASVFKENWDTSPHAIGGTPGMANEVPEDTTSPTLRGFSIAGSQTLQLAFSERLDEGSAENTGNYSLSGAPGITSATATAADSVELRLSTAPENNTKYTLTVNGITDIFDNILANRDTTFTFFEVSPVDSGDVFINEFMFDPPAGSVEYIEVYNPTAKSLDLNGWTINDNTGSRQVLASSRFVLPPDSFVVLSADKTLLNRHPDIALIIPGSRFPSLNNSGDDIVLRDSAGALLDSLRYASAWDGNEVALERRTTSVAGFFRENFGKAPDGKSTPGRANSISADTTPPGLTNLTIPDSLSLQLVFDESLQDHPASDVKNYSLSGGIAIRTASPVSRDTVQLTLSSPLQNAIRYTLTLDGLHDLFGNTLSGRDTTFAYFQISAVDSGDIFISEFMFDPPAGSVEYIELHNSTTKSLDLQGWTLNDNTGIQRIISPVPFILPPDSFVVLTPDYTLLKDHPDIALVAMGSRFPSLNNSGDDIVLRAGNGMLLDSLRYTSAWGGNEIALERRTTSVSGTFRENFGDAPGGFGTPGYKNKIPMDVTAPAFTRLTVQSATSFQLLFSEHVTPESATDASNYRISPRRDIQLIAAREDTVTLFVSEKLQSGQTYQVTVSNLKDLFGNTLAPAAKEVSFLKFSPSRPGDIVINEIRYNPADGSEAEFVELYNTTDKNFDLSGWQLGDASSGRATLAPGTQLRSRDYLVLTDNTIFANRLGNAQEVPGFPSLNAGGDAVFIRTDAGVTVDSLFYTSGWGGHQKGTSLERKDPRAASNDDSNWQTNSSPEGHTAGLQNAVFRPDITPPAILFSKQLPDRTLEVQFSEFIKLTPDLIFSMGGAALSVAQFDSVHADIILLDVPAAKVISAPAMLTAQNLTDVKGNTATAVRMPVAQKLEPADVVINEIMYHPLNDPDDNQPDQSEYIELRNTRDYAVSLEGITLHDAPDENGEVRSLVPVSTKARFIPAGGIVLIYADEARGFDQSRIAGFFELDHSNNTSGIRIDRTTLSLASSDDAIYLADSSGITIDSVFYDESWQNPNLLDTRGMALERIRPAGPGNDASNWSSSIHPKGGTPGSENSIYQPAGNTPENTGISFTPNPFSPDDDGTEDHLMINYRLDEADYLIKVWIYDRYGRQIRELADGKPAGFEGSLIWDGRKDDGTANRIGIYIVVFEAFNSANGKDRAFKKTVVLARRLH